MQFNSKIIEDAVLHLSSFPGIGKKTALRMVLHLINSKDVLTRNIADSIVKLKTELKFCEICNNISEETLCSICTNGLRNDETWCVVEDFKDVISIENTAQFKGRYHVLGGLISPIDGVGPEDIFIDGLIKRIEENAPKEIIIALNATMEGDTTLFYISKVLKPYNIAISTLSKGIAVGGEIDYADEITLGSSILNRTKYEV